MEIVPLLNLPVHSALTGDHIADVSLRAEDTAFKLSEAASTVAGLDVNLRLVRDGRRIEETETLVQAGFCDQEQVLAVAERRQRQINSLIEVYEKAERLNACFMVDCTGSMGGHICAVKEQIHGIVREMQMRLPNMQLRLSFLGYRDHCDDVRFEVLPFTTSVEEFRAFVAQVRAKGGGGDGPEDVHGAVNLACSLDWAAGDAATRVLIHIADHPAHGRHWNESPRDSYPDGDPYGLDLPALMQQLQSVDVQYVFGHVTWHTHKMVRVLNEELGGYIDTKDMNDAAKVTETVTASLHSSVATTVSTLSSHGKPRMWKPEELSSELPDWSHIPILPVRLRTCLPVDDVAELRADAHPRATQRLVETEAKVQLAPVPFSQGESRLAWHALLNGNVAVAKQFKERIDRVNAEDEEDNATDDLNAMLILSEVSAVAALLADTFSQLHPELEEIQFLGSAVADGSGVEPFNIESTLAVADFTRYSNNIGWWEADPPKTLLHFTRWTHEITGGHMMVADLQGVKTSRGWLLTDPCILCGDTSRFGSGNLGPYAMTRCTKALSSLLDPPELPAKTLESPIIGAPPNVWKDTGKRPDGSLAAPLDVDALISQYVRTGYNRGKPFQAKEGEIRQLLAAARDTFLRQPSLLELDAPIKVMGDIHGQFADLLKIFECNGLPPTSNYLMLGDYVDRGKHSIETITLLLAFKVKYPEKFFLLRGNHECASITRIYGFFDECKRKYNIKLWKAFCDVFNCLPPAALIEQKIFCMHGGISPELSTFDQIRSMARPTDVPDTGLLCDLLWADPDKDVTGWAENDRGVSYTYGPDTLNTFHNRFGTDLVVRAHQVVEDGYEFFGNRQLVTLFSAPNYGGEFNNSGAVLSISDSLMCSFQVLSHDWAKREAQKDQGALTSVVQRMLGGKNKTMTKAID